MCFAQRLAGGWVGESSACWRAALLLLLLLLLLLPAGGLSGRAAQAQALCAGLGAGPAAHLLLHGGQRLLQLRLGPHERDDLGLAAPPHDLQWRGAGREVGCWACSRLCPALARAPAASKQAPSAPPASPPSPPTQPARSSRTARPPAPPITTNHQPHHQQGRAPAWRKGRRGCPRRTAPPGSCPPPPAGSPAGRGVVCSGGAAGQGRSGRAAGYWVPPAGGC
jgi:hypothetical protein